MNETRKRIREYKSALPSLRERVVAVGLLLILSATIMSVASFAWFTLSRAPEVASIATQIAANGNLEIALSGPDGQTAPGESKIGDSSAAEGQTVANSNLTWGNLVNLSDPSYGLEQVILRPAVLNNSKLGTEPFRSVIYGADGRVSHDQNSKFSYCTWEPANDEIATPHFGVTGKYGVRAIATVTERFESELGGNPEQMVKYYGYLGAAETENSKVDTIYQGELIGDEANLNALATIMGYYMQSRINSQYNDLNNPECTDQIASLNKLYSTFLKAMDQELSAMVALANVQQYVFTKSDSYTPCTVKTLLESTEAELTAKGIRLKNLTSFVNDYNTVKADAATVAGMAADVTEIGRQVFLTEIKPLIDRLVTVDSCVVKADGTTTTIGAIGGVSAALDIAGAKDVDVEIQDGILARFEERAGTYVYKEDMGVTVTVRRELFGSPVTLPQTVKADIYTKHYQKSNLFNEDVAWTQEAFENSGLANGKKILTAGDTYGLAVDFWVRTNAGDPETGLSYLVLEGKLQYEQDTGTDANGNSVGLLFKYTVKDEATETETDYYVYQTEDGKWYEDYKKHESNNEVTAATLAGKQMTEVYKDAPVGYEGENRVWEEIQQATLQPPLSEYNTTQGNGSCYTFYADSPQDQQMILNLLKHMYVVFTDGGDGYLSMARFDAEENHYYAVGGKVTVPLVIMQSNYSFLNELGESVDAIVELKQDVAKRITALVYLDGKELSNKEALAASDIQGTLNLQFGNNIAMTTLGDSVLQEQERAVTATVETAKGDNVLDFFTDSLASKVTVNVTGDQPASVKAFFQREINAYQGSRQETMTFRQEGNAWVCDDFTFPAPGKYVLRSVMLDGVEYELRETPVVTVQGVFLSTLDVTRDSQLLATRDNTIMTADSGVTLNLAATFATDDAKKLPKEVIVEFVRADGSSVSVDMSATTNGWTGTTTISTSGYYEMTYVVLDGERYDLDTLGKTFDLYLGLSAIVEAMPGTPQIVPLEDEEAVALGIRAKIVDNSGNPLKELPKFSVFYKGRGTGEELEAPVNWNGTTGYYEGRFHVNQPDAYQFYYLNPQGNYISAYKSAVVFVAKTNKPASYVECTNSGNTMFVLPGENTVAELLVRLRNVPGGTPMRATYQNSKGQSYVVDENTISVVPNSTVNGVTTWKIPVPTVDGSQAGEWTLKKLALGNVMDSNGRDYTLDNPLIFTLAEENGGEPTITVVSDIEVTLGNVATNTFNGAFMDSHAVDDLSVNLFFKDTAGNAMQLPEQLVISEVTLHYVHQNDSVALGQYAANATVPEISVAMKDSGDGIKFVQSAAMNLQIAGTYKLKNVTYKLNTKEYSAEISTGAATKFTVGSAKPTVIVTGITPNGKHPSMSGTGDGATDISSVESKIVSNYEANVNVQVSKSNEGTIQVHPSVTLTVGGMGNATQASMQFINSSGGVETMYAEKDMGSSNEAFTWTANGGCTRYVGKHKSGKTCSSMENTPAGKLTSSTLVLTYNGADYSFTVPTITINNTY